MYVGIYTHYAESFDTVVEDIQAKKPTVLLAVPRVCEKVYAKILGQAKEQAPWKQAIFNWAVGIGAEVSKLMEEKRPIPSILNLKYKIAYKMVFETVKDAGAANSMQIADVQFYGVVAEIEPEPVE